MQEEYKENKLMSQLPRLNYKRTNSRTTVQDLYDTNYEARLPKDKSRPYYSSYPATAENIKSAYPEIQKVNGWAEAIVQTARRLRIADPGWLANLMYFETGFTLNPNVMNKNGCGGLLNFCPNSSAKKVGKTVTELTSMEALEQMQYVELYLSEYKGKYNTSADLYMAVYFPIAQGGGPHFSIYNWYLKHMGEAVASNFLNANNGIKTAGDYQKFADRHARLPTVLGTEKEDTSSVVLY